MKFKIYILSFLLAATGISCNKDFLDTVPFNGLSSTKIFENDANAKLAVNGMYQAIAQNAFKDFFPTLTANLGPDAYTYGRNGQVFGSSFSIGQGTARDNWVTNIYTGLYRPIVYANDIIAGLEGNEKVNEVLGNRLIGEAKFIRGLCYFYLWNFYGDVVLIDKPTPVNETFLPRSPVADVQAFVISDFKDAVEKLPESYPAADLGRATKGAAIAMLGKTYLYLQRWQDAETEFAKLLQAPFTYDLTDNFFDSFYWQTQNNKESVFEIQYSMEPSMGSAFDIRFGNRAIRGQGQDYTEASITALSVFQHSDGTSIDISGYPKRNSYPNGNAGEVPYGKDLIHWYDTTFANADLRLHQSVILPGATFLGANDKIYKVYWPYKNYASANPPALRTTWTTVGVIPVRKFLTLGMDNITTTTNNCPTNFPLIRFADVLLMYAEAANEARGPVQEVYDAINRVRARAHVAGFPDGLSQEQMRREIRLERYRELMFESHLYFDVRRWKLANTSDPIFGLNKDELDFRFEKLLTRVFTDREYLLPIPAGEIDLNPLMTQNNGWE
ncbi:MAG: RagB/SusD family nutrient uptake outer membrane protein [Bacteroidia bacterium]|nr:RagB/SusD family nutrient uptake outer membrane protein [Bacteroidia bacterium]